MDEAAYCSLWLAMEASLLDEAKAPDVEDDDAPEDDDDEEDEEEEVEEEEEEAVEDAACPDLPDQSRACNILAWRLAVPERERVPK
ncbi:hypothetical protein ACOMHN_006056 [Nucella lapillus]